MSRAAAACAGVALWFSFGALAFTDADTARRVGLLPAIWWLPLFVLGALALTAAIRLSDRGSVPLFLSALILLPWLPFPVPQLFFAFSGPSVALIWAAIGLAFLASSLARRQLMPFLRHPRRAPLTAALVAFVAILAARLGQRMPPSGDEPHYLLITQSLLRDHDVQVANNYERGDYLQYYGGLLEPHLSRPGLAGPIYSLHAPGLPAVVAPSFAIAGYPGVVVWLSALTAIGTAFVWMAAYALTGDARAAWFGWAVVALTVPVVLLGSLVYPDAVAGTIIAGAVFAIVASARALNRPWRLWGSLGVGGAVGILPWLHTRLAPTAAVLTAILALRIVQEQRFAAARGRHLVALLAPVFCCGLAWLGFFRIVYGTFNPGAPFAESTLLDLRRAVGGGAGLLFDQEFGLLFNAPVHLVSSVGLWMVIRRSTRLPFELLAVSMPYALTVSAWPAWWAGFSPPARLLVPVVLPLGVAAAAFWASVSARGRALAVTFLGVSIVIAGVLSFGGGGVLAYNGLTGRARWLDWVAPLVDLPRAFPSAFRGDLAAPVVVWTLALGAGALMFRIFEGRVSRSSVGAFALPVWFVTVSAIAVAVTWRVVGHANPIATRGQLDLLRASGRTAATGAQVFPPRLLSVLDVRARIALTTSPLDHPEANTLLALEEVPPGEYRLHIAKQTDGQGELALGVGHASVPAARWTIGHWTTSPTIRLPLTAPLMTITGDSFALKSIEHVALMPVPGNLGSGFNGRAYDAGRYGSVVVFATDERVWLEPDGIWVMGERQPDLVFVTDEPTNTIHLDIGNGPVVNRVRLRVGEWITDHPLAPGEHWSVEIPLSRSDVVHATLVNVDVAHGFRPAHVDPTSTDRRLLGCWITLPQGGRIKESPSP